MVQARETAEQEMMIFFRRTYDGLTEENEKLKELVAQWQKTWEDFTPMNAAKNEELETLKEKSRQERAEVEAQSEELRKELAQWKELAKDLKDGWNQAAKWWVIDRERWAREERELRAELEKLRK